MIDKTRKLISGGQVILPDDVVLADVLVEGDKIAAIGHPGIFSNSDTQQVDATGCYVFPGIIDAHTHINLDTGIYKTVDGWAEGTKAAAFGGVTTVIDFANQIKGRPFEDALAVRKQEAADAAIDYAFHMVVLEADQNSDNLRDKLKQLLAMGVTSIKLFTTYRPNYYMDDASILRIFRAMPDDMIAMVHCENDSIVTEATKHFVDTGHTTWYNHGLARPADAEAEAVNRILKFAEYTRTRVYIAHVSTSTAADYVTEMRLKKDLPIILGAWSKVFYETCPQYLLLSSELYYGEDAERYILQPPLRTSPDFLHGYVSQNTVDVLSTDSCDYSLEQKRSEPNFTKTPGGLPGIETLLPLMYTTFHEDMFLPDLIKLMTENPARLFGLYPRKGVIRVGSDADLVIYDPQPDGTIRVEDMHFLAGYTPFEGMPVKGKVRTVLSRGEIIVDGEDYYGTPGRGQFLPGGPSLDPR